MIDILNFELFRIGFFGGIGLTAGIIFGAVLILTFFAVIVGIFNLIMTMVNKDEQI